MCGLVFYVPQDGNVKLKCDSFHIEMPLVFLSTRLVDNEMVAKRVDNLKFEHENGCCRTPHVVKSIIWLIFDIVFFPGIMSTQEKLCSNFIVNIFVGTWLHSSTIEFAGHQHQHSPQRKIYFSHTPKTYFIIHQHSSDVCVFGTKLKKGKILKFSKFNLHKIQIPWKRRGRAMSNLIT